MRKKHYKKIVFLDIDGVLNSVASVIYHHGKKDANKLLCPIAVSNLKYLLKKNPDARICISSTWRKVLGIYGTTVVLKKHGIPKGKIIGCTPITFSSRNRAGEILEWLEDHDVEKFVILDDNSYYFNDFPNLKEAFIRTNRATGFTMVDAANAHDKLGGKEDIYPVVFF
jgi:hypothetical protein